MRNDCRDIVIGEQRGIKIEKNTLAGLAHHRICSLAFHNEVMTARPIADLWCALIYEETRADMKLAQDIKDVICGVSRTISVDFKKISEGRNHLLHASWNIGTWYDPEDFTYQFSVQKFRAGQQGFAERSDLPKNLEELIEYTGKVTEIKTRISDFNSTRRHLPANLPDKYKGTKGRWVARKT